MKFSAAVTASIVAAASTMSHANASLNVMSDKASLAAKDAAKALMDKHDLAYLVASNEGLLAASIKLDGQPLSIPTGMLLAAYENADSTTQNIYNPTLTSNCYSNCYSNCHGSRSWR